MKEDMSDRVMQPNHALLRAAEAEFTREGGQFYYQYVNFWADGTVVLDGTFDARELAFILERMLTALEGAP